jgi:Family of unknown function (DUF5898)
MIELENQILLVMPYIPQLTDHDKEVLRKPSGLAKIREALKFFASRGFEHEDMHWHHIGRVPSRDRRSFGRVVFVDLGSVRRVQWGSSEQARWIRRTTIDLKWRRFTN